MAVRNKYVPADDEARNDDHRLDDLLLPLIEIVSNKEIQTSSYVEVTDVPDWCFQN